uniref:Pecanex-like protein n=1 Tax=Elaeophora elaphi TaxID=1147741 RepID=A0A158Q7T0_9BILA
MTVGSHVAEIVRQGIWASLTGGWYYEPGYTLFCNAVHLYLWLILFLIPLLLGVSFDSVTSVYVTVAYVTFIVLLFVILKFTVSYLHNLFDTVDPTPYPPARSLKVGSFSCETAQHSNERFRDEEIEMVDLRKKDDEEAEGISCNLSRSSLGRRRCVRIGGNSVSSADGEVRMRKEGGGEWDEDRSSGWQSGRELLSPPITTLLPVDSLELLSTGIRHQSDNGKIQCIGIDRKFSEPCLKEAQKWNRTRCRRFSDTGPCVRRAKSAFETSNKESVASGSVLSERTLEECKQIIRKSYPTKMSSTAAFLSSALTKRTCPSHSGGLNFDSKLKPDSSDLCFSKKKNPTMFDESNEQQNSEKISVLDIPSTSKDAEKKTFVMETVMHLEPDSEPKTNVVSSGEGWRPIFVSLGDLERPSTSTLHRTSERVNGGDNVSIIGSSSRGMGLKGEITKFLEELIDKHPETLDAIESVRMNRLGRGLSSANSCLHSYPPNLVQPRMIERSSATVAALSNLAMKDGFHVALDHEDTSQGAVHSFQDEDGNWWTYVFDEHGVGTAHALGSSRALMEMIQSNSTTANVKLAALPESDSDSTEDSDIDPAAAANITEGCSRTQLLEGASLSAADRCRALSSSSTESSTYIADTPSAIYHASSSALMSRHPNRDRQIVSFSMMAARLRNATRRRSHGSFVRGNNFLEEHAAERMPQVTHVMSTNEHQRALDDAGRTSLHAGSPRLLRRMPFFSDISGIGTSDSSRISAQKKSHYYRIKLFPSLTGGKGIKLEAKFFAMDRLSVAALFDRNSTLFSTIFDICLASIVALLAAIVLSRSIYYDLSLVLFAFVVAGTHFSLLKSVQPDAASPIHGFNWLVTYSRPIYFLIMAVALLLISGDWWDYRDAIRSLEWEWNLYRLQNVPLTSIFLACRDILSVLLILLPIAFTFGLLPQVNTLALHLLEQVEMNVFGGTASFSLLSGFIQISKSLVAFGLLCFISRAAKHTDPNGTQNAFFSAFTAAAVAVSYLLSRSTSNPGLMALSFRYMISSSKCVQLDVNQEAESETKDGEVTPCLKDPLPDELRTVIMSRIRSDVIISLLILLLFFALHCTSVFTVAQPFLQTVTCIVCIIFGFINHYLYMELRKNTPWRIFARPILRAHEFAQFESSVAAKLMYFEIIHFYMLAIERNMLYPLMVISTITSNKWTLHPYFIALFALRILRSAFSQPQLMFLPLAFSFLLTKADLAKYPHIDRYFPLLFYFAALVWPKLLEFSLKINFILAYVAPWQISWGSAFHAFAQPFSVPHTAFSCIQTILSSIISAPLNPFLGSSFFLTSYVRPVKFWEKDYNTRRVDHSNTRLISQIDRGPMMDDSNLNAVFYEHLTRSLQSSLAGDILLGRWSTAVQPGDCFILASYYLNCLVHIIEVGNGFVTFQLRGLEFRGTYCHQREVEAISEDVGEGMGCCCCSLGLLPGMLSLNTAWVLRWLAWEVVTAKYIVDGYSITDNSAVNLLQVHELRRLLVTLYVKSIIFYALNSPKFAQWIRLPNILCALRPIETNNRYGVSRQSFTELYESWILHCVEQHPQQNADLNAEKTSINRINAFCFALSVVGRRALAAAAHNRHANAAESFLYGLHALFKGDFRITCQRDEWVFADMDLLRCVVAPAVRMALKLHQDHFTAGDDFDDAALLYERITHHLTRLFISHEHDPAWRRAIIANTPTLLALRHIYDDGQDDYKIIMLNKMHLNMRVIKLNRECVRAFWAGQQQELIFLRNRNPERGSIQNARQVLRNMINSSADQPIGYPIYVSPLTTSFVDSHPQVRSMSIPPMTFDFISRSLHFLWASLRMNFGTSGSSNIPTQLMMATATTGIITRTNSNNEGQANVEHQGEILACATASARTAQNNRQRYTTASSTMLRLENSIVSVAGDGVAKVTLCKNALKSLEANDTIHRGGLLLDSSRDEQAQYAKITDIEQVFTCLDEPLKSTGEPLVAWPHVRWQTLGGRSSWDWMPLKGHRGKVVHKWMPLHPRRERRSHAGTIYLLCVKEMGGCYVPVGENGIEFITKEEYERDVKTEMAVKMEFLKA